MGACHYAPDGWCDDPKCVEGCKKRRKASGPISTRMNFDGTPHVCTFNADGHCPTHATTQEAPISSKEQSLLPCPFCGAPATLETIESKASPGDLRFSAGCNTEDCIGYQSVITFARRGEAATAWNRRTLSGDSSADVLRTDDDPLKPPAVETDELSVAFWKAEAIAATRIVKAAAKAFPNDDGWLHAAQSFLSAEGLSDETKAPHEDKADLLSMAALIARLGREDTYHVSAELLTRASAVLVALADSRPSVQETSVVAPIESFPMTRSCFLHGDHAEENCPKCEKRAEKASGEPTCTSEWRGQDLWWCINGDWISDQNLRSWCYNNMGEDNPSRYADCIRQCHIVAYANRSAENGLANEGNK